MFPDPRAGCGQRCTIARMVVTLWIAALPLALPAADLDDARDLHRAGQLDAALQAYADIIAADAAPRADVATAHNNSCVILLNRGENHDAIPHCIRAVELRRESGDTARLARALNNFALVSQNLGNYSDAGDAYREALQINRASGDLESEALNLANLSWLATKTAQYSRAMALQESVMTLTRAHPDAPWSARQQQIALLNQGVTLERLGAYRQALDLYKGMLDEGESLAAAHRVALQVNLGVVYRNLGDPVSALAMFQEARDAYRELGDQAGLGNVFLNIGLVQHINLQRPAAAREAYRNALQLARDSGDIEDEVQALCFLGHLLLQQSEWQQSQTRFRDARALASADEAGEGTWNALYGLARVAMFRGQPQQALELLDEAMGSVESIRAGLDHGRLRAGFFGDRRSVYALAVDALAVMQPQRETAAAEAFAVVQRAKARELLDALGSDAGQRAPVSPADLQGSLGDSMLLDYFDAGTNMYRFTVTRDRLQMQTVGETRQLTSQVGQLYDQLSRRRVVSEPLLETLSRALFGKDLDRAIDTVWVVPDRALYYLPFELLPKTTPGGAPLVASATVVYLPSASFQSRPNAGAAPVRTFVGFGDPVLNDSGSTSVDPRRLLTSEFNLEPLPGSGRELEDIANLLGVPVGAPEHRSGGIHIGPQATEAIFREHVGEGARVVHLATHTVIDNGAGRRAAVVLSADEDDDGLLYPEEIAGLNYHAMLTVLATCRSAFGSEVDGYGLGSLGGALMAAGSDSVLVTLWDVGDNATKAFMHQFYFFLGRGESPSVALRLAKNRLRAQPEWSNPALWSGYVLIGDAAPIGERVRKTGPAAILVLGLALLAVSGLYLKRIKSVSNSSGNA